MSANYRKDATSALNRANDALKLDDVFILRYAALELRMALECLVYERALNYTKELSNKKLSTWQPKKLLELLLEIDPFADQTRTVSISLGSKINESNGGKLNLGTDRLISLREIKKYYDSLGSYLHAPTIDQSKSGKCCPDDNLRRKCEELINIIEGVINSPVWNVSM